jgi:hypothetical protein
MFVDGSAKRERREKAMRSKQGSAFITTRKGFCYLTIKCGRCNFHVMRIRAYTLDADDKRQMRRLYPDVDFDWKKIARQLAEKREVCRRYRSRWRTSDAAHLSRVHAPFYGLYEPGTRTIYVNGFPRNAQTVGALLDAVLHLDRTLTIAASSSPSEGVRREAKPNLQLAKGSRQPERPQGRGSDDC